MKVVIPLVSDPLEVVQLTVRAQRGMKVMLVNLSVERESRLGLRITAREYGHRL